jgi:mono/diheme cytochrome c family protein
MERRRGLRGTTLVIALAASALAAACAERRELPASPEPPDRVTYEADVKPLFDARCVSCHSGANPAAQYDMSTLDGIVGNGTDGVPNAIAGDPLSRLVVESKPGGSMNSFYSSPDEVALVERWVVEDSLAAR